MLSHGILVMALAFPTIIAQPLTQLHQDIKGLSMVRRQIDGPVVPPYARTWLWESVCSNGTLAYWEDARSWEMVHQVKMVLGGLPILNDRIMVNRTVTAILQQCLANFDDRFRLSGPQMSTLLDEVAEATQYFSDKFEQLPALVAPYKPDAAPLPSLDALVQSACSTGFDFDRQATTVQVLDQIRDILAHTGLLPMSNTPDARTLIQLLVQSCVTNLYNTHHFSYTVLSKIQPLAQRKLLASLSPLAPSTMTHGDPTAVQAYDAIQSAQARAVAQPSSQLNICDGITHPGDLDQYSGQDIPEVLIYQTAQALAATGVDLADVVAVQFASIKILSDHRKMLVQEQRYQDAVLDQAEKDAVSWLISLAQAGNLTAHGAANNCL